MRFHGRAFVRVLLLLRAFLLCGFPSEAKERPPFFGGSPKRRTPMRVHMGCWARLWLPLFSKANVASTATPRAMLCVNVVPVLHHLGGIHVQPLRCFPIEICKCQMGKLQRKRFGLVHGGPAFAGRSLRGRPSLALGVPEKPKPRRSKHPVRPIQKAPRQESGGGGRKNL